MSNKPMYRQIADAFREKINAGELKPGDALPTESSLQEAFRVSRVTVRQALKLLADEQIIESIQGSGSYVKKEERVNYDIYQLTGFYEKLADRHVDTHSDVKIFEVVKADARLAATLAVGVEDKVWHVKRVRFIKQKPVNLEETWMPLAMFPDLTWEVMENSKYHYVEQIKKLVIDRSEQELMPIMPSEEAIAALSLDPAKPILEKVSRGFLKDGRVFEYSRNVFNTDDYKFTLVARRRQ
ncbi:GntR family transcriptional regulator [Enterobacter bugandensis]|uniref:GntR family transcriptional regulator n=1 Tax=Enterobacter bugandensis TaxID=881260 RepID=A0AA42PRW8_9ENTR|nr:GntR family transcriptional regulator [Enterobacter bugandensis]MDH1317452.1 GntR family transcriptional regulator [Enterobacter bugandensis]